jgi:hypothetical protein
MNESKINKMHRRMYCAYTTDRREKKMIMSIGDDGDGDDDDEREKHVPLFLCSLPLENAKEPLSSFVLILCHCHCEVVEQREILNTYSGGLSFSSV